jgi:hypothetical protein
MQCFCFILTSTLQGVVAPSQTFLYVLAAFLTLEWLFNAYAVITQFCTFGKISAFKVIMPLPFPRCITVTFELQGDHMESSVMHSLLHFFTL